MVMAGELREEGRGVESAGGKQVPLEQGSQQGARSLQGSLHLLRQALTKIHGYVHRLSTKDTGGMGLPLGPVQTITFTEHEWGVGRRRYRQNR